LEAPGEATTPGASASTPLKDYRQAANIAKIILVTLVSPSVSSAVRIVADAIS